MKQPCFVHCLGQMLFCINRLKQVKVMFDYYVELGAMETYIVM